MTTSDRPLSLVALLELAGRTLGVGLDETSPYEESFEVVFREGRASRVHVAKRLKMTHGQFDITIPRSLLERSGAP